MAGATFLRADLHVHTFADTVEDPDPDLGAYIAAAESNGIAYLAVTDHNTTRFVKRALDAADGSSVFVVPGIEVSTHEGHLLALHSPEELDSLETFAAPGALQLRTLPSGEKRSDRSMLDLVRAVHSTGGLAIPAHVDASNGIVERLRPAALEELLSSPALAGLEFATPDALKLWFTDDDPDPHRLAAWKARQRVRTQGSRAWPGHVVRRSQSGCGRARPTVANPDSAAR